MEERTFFRIEFPKAEGGWYFNRNAEFPSALRAIAYRSGFVRNSINDPEASRRYASSRVVRVTEQIEVVLESESA